MAAAIGRVPLSVSHVYDHSAAQYTQRQKFGKWKDPCREKYVKGLLLGGLAQSIALWA